MALRAAHHVIAVVSHRDGFGKALAKPVAGRMLHSKLLP
jgi:hypothetical protein